MRRAPRAVREQRLDRDERGEFGPLDGVPPNGAAEPLDTARPGSSRTKPARRVLANLLVVALACALALALGEFVVRALYKQQTVLFPRYHTDFRYGQYTLRGIRPDSDFWHTSPDGSWRFVTNDRGFRDVRRFTYAKPAGTLRVLSLGDSHTQGYEVRQEATFSSVLERYLRGRGLKAEVLNAGVSGFSTAEELAFLENEGHKYEPDVVVLGFYANDFEDNLKAGLFALEGGQLVERKYEHIPGVRIQNVIYSVPGVRWLGEHSYLYSLLFNTVWERFQRLLTEQAVREYAVATRATQSDNEIALGIALLARMQRYCAERGIRLIVVDVPRAPEPYRFSESLPAGVLQAFSEMHTEFVSSRSLLGDFDGAAEMHVLHGHNHISEFTHALIGVELGRRIVQTVKQATR